MRANVKMLCWFSHRQQRVKVLLVVNKNVEKPELLFCFFVSRCFFSELRCRVLDILIALFAPIIGIDIYQLTVYLCPRRRLKGLVKTKVGRSKVSWVISSMGQPEERPDPKKPTAQRGAVGVWNCESGDRIKGRDGAYSTLVAPSQELRARA